MTDRKLLEDVRDALDKVMEAYQRYVLTASGETDFYAADPSVIRAATTLARVEAALAETGEEAVRADLRTRAFYLYRAWADRLDDQQAAAAWDGLSLADVAEWIRRVREYEAQLLPRAAIAAMGE